MPFRKISTLENKVKLQYFTQWMLLQSFAIIRTDVKENICRFSSRSSLFVITKCFKKYFRRFNLIYIKNNSNTDFPFGIFRSFNNNLFNYRFTTFVSSKLFLYPLKASENLMATYWNKWVKTSNSRIMKDAIQVCSM